MKLFRGLFIALMLCIFAGCNDSDTKITVHNNSAGSVSYTLNGIPETLTIESREVQEFRYTDNFPRSYSGNAHPVAYKVIDPYSFEFIDISPLELQVVNSWPFNINVSAGGFIENSQEKEPLAIPANSTGSGHIYTSSPQFTLTTDSGKEISAAISIQIIDDIMYVMIR
jgi:hypothetical protein